MTLAACDAVYGLERPPPGQFCLQKAVEDAAFCADFDDVDGTNPLAAFDAPDQPDRYAADEKSAHSLPRGARMTIQGLGDAKLTRLVDVGGSFEVSVWIQIAELDTTDLDSIKVLALGFGDVTASVYERVIYLASDGKLNEKVGAMFPMIKQVDSFTLGRWTHVGIAIDVQTAKGEITSDNDTMPFDVTPIQQPDQNVHVLVRLGPHDGQPLTTPIATEVFVDDVVVRTDGR